MSNNYTIKQIAEIAGVHRSTVDKVLHNRPGVGPEVRARVKKVLNEVDYKPNLFGKALKQQKKLKKIGVLLLNTSSIHMLSEGVSQAAQEFGRFGIVPEIYYTNFWDVKSQSETIKRLIDEGISGIVIHPLDTPEVIEALNMAVLQNIPVICVCSDLKDCRRMCFVGQNPNMAAKTAARMTAEIMHGKGRLAIVSGLYDLLNAISVRSTVFQSHLKAIAPDIKIAGEVKTMDDEAFVMYAVAEFLQENPVDYLYQTSGGVEWTARAIRLLEVPTKIVCFDTYPQHLMLVREGVVTCTIGQELVKQGYMAIKLLFDYFYYGEKPEAEFYYTDVDIRVLENVDVVGANFQNA